MEVDKILFESLRTLGITDSFEELDIDGDGKISKDDLSLAQDGKISSQIIQMLDLADDDAELLLADSAATKETNAGDSATAATLNKSGAESLQKSGATKNEWGINQTDATNYANDITKSKGTVYLVLGNLPSCHGCLKLEEALQKRLDEFEGKAEIFNMQWKSPNSDLCYDIYKQVVSNIGSNIGFPCIIKFVDGKPVERISEGYAGNADAIVDEMLSKAEGTNSTANKTTNNTTNANNSTSNKTQTASQTGVAVNEYGFYQTDSRTYEQDITNTKGTVYLVMGNLPGCGHCARLEKLLQERKSEVEANANIFNIQWRTSEYDNNALCWSILEQIDAKRSFGGGFPVVVKFVDGKPVEMISQGNKSDFNVVIDEMIKKSEGTKGTVNAKNSSSTTTTTASSTKTEADITAAANDLLAKYPVEGTTHGGYSLNNPEVAALKKAVEAGVLSQLAEQGFSQKDIIDIISKAYPTSGIKNNDKGGFTVPRGSGADAKEFYNMFIQEMGKVTSPEVLALQQEMKELNAQILYNNARLDALKASIEILKNELNKKIEDAIEESEEIAEEQKEEAKKIVNEEIDKYASGDGEITYDQFQSGLSSRLDSLAGESNSKLSAVVSKILNAERGMIMLGGYINNFRSLVASNKDIGTKLQAKEAELIKTQEECTSSCENVQRCDPIGFSSNGARYDFFVDKDNNGKITNEKEFLGASSGWEEMTALDADKDGKVTVAEMADVKIVMTAEDGTQSIKSVAEVFADTDSIDLNSYKAANKDFDNGNTLLGTFSLTFNGQNVDNAYQTMDTLSWLDENYDFSDEEDGINRFAQGNTSPIDNVRDYSNELTVFELDYQNMEVKLGSAWAKLGITRDSVISKLTDSMKNEADSQASEIESLFKKRAADAAAAEEDDCPECSVQVPDDAS
ncbi:MAG: thioredoxin family protein [bacterium]|nr:thioredoxin family protein [bacterium]